MSLNTLHPEKPLSQQVSERMRRAEDERPLYQIRWGACLVTLADGSQRREMIATVTRRAEYLRRGETQTSYYVTAAGCCCPDACEARRLNLFRPCKHSYMSEMDLAERSGWPGEDEEYVADEAAAEDTLALLAGRTLPSREEIRRRMEQDFPSD